MTAIDSLLRDADSRVSDALNRALSGRNITEDEAHCLISAQGADAFLVGMTADELRRRAVGDTATYVVNRNINFTNVCVKQCGFCAFSRDFREEEGYYLPTSEIVRRAKEASLMGATEVCIQAGLPPDMEGDAYENICRAIKSEIPDIHIHGFSPEEVLYGTMMSGCTIEEFLRRLRDAGVGTLPGTSAEILDQNIRDRISPGRITVKEWTSVIKAAHRLGIRTTSTMMFGHVESKMDRVRHIARIRDIQKETGGFTEFVPLNFIHTEAPMYARMLHKDTRPGASAADTLLTHAVSRIMLSGVIDNIQISWVKEGPRLAQLLLHWGANDFGGTLINESISTSAGAPHGQLLRPGEIRNLIRDAGRTPAERDTLYGIRRIFESETQDKLDAADAAKFGSYFELIKIKEFRYGNKSRSAAGSAQKPA